MGKAIGQLEQLTANVESLTQSFKEVEISLASLRPIDNWKKGDQTLFCLEAERLNPDWKCPKFDK